MPITFAEAERIAKQLVPTDGALAQQSTLEEPDGWYFCIQSKRFLESGDPLEQFVGTGGLMVNRETGHVLEFGSARQVEWYLDVYRKGFHYEKYDLTITSVSNAREATRILLQFGLSYVVPEEGHGVTWRIPRTYTAQELGTMLDSLPVTFEKVGLFHSFDIYESLQNSGSCVFTVREVLPDPGQGRRDG